MLMLNKTPAAAMTSPIAFLPCLRANRALVRFRMTSSYQENGFVGLAALRDRQNFCQVVSPIAGQQRDTTTIAMTLAGIARNSTSDAARVSAAGMLLARG